MTEHKDRPHHRAYLLTLKANDPMGLLMDTQSGRAVQQYRQSLGDYSEEIKIFQAGDQGEHYLISHAEHDPSQAHQLLLTNLRECGIGAVPITGPDLDQVLSAEREAMRRAQSVMQTHLHITDTGSAAYRDVIAQTVKPFETSHGEARLAVSILSIPHQNAVMITLTGEADALAQLSQSLVEALMAADYSVTLLDRQQYEASQRRLVKPHFSAQDLN